MSISPYFSDETQEAQTLVPYVLVRRPEKLHDSALEGILAATLDEMDAQWQAGQLQGAEHWIDLHPELAGDQEAAVRIVYEEFCLREGRGEQVDPEELYRRFPQWRDALAIVLDCHRLLRGTESASQFPTAGERLGDLQLLTEIGRGALGRVYLATQPSLSDRPLVVKLTARTGQEHLSLARLQHTHIVPLYLVEDFPEVNLRGLCMPYLGGATWSAVLKSLENIALARRTGKQIADRLNEPSKVNPVLNAASGPAAGFLARSSYVDAVCWIGACLADALYYAHQRGVVHLDIKPSNVLIAADGQPMLLDFHLACEVQRLKHNNVDRLGGTPGYMSPEQLAAAECIRRGVDLQQPIDERSDIYSLGVLLYESLSGDLPQANIRDLRRHLQQANPQVSRGLADIVCKCLAPALSARYRDAAQLAADLRNHLSSLPLRGVGNHSVRERWQKWRRRKPHAFLMLLVCLAAAGIFCAVGGLYYRDRVQFAEDLLRQSRQELNSNQFTPALTHAEAASAALNWLPSPPDFKSQLKTQLEATRRAKATAGLHEFVEQLRFADGQAIGHEQLGEILAGCDQLWKLRTELVAQTDKNAAYQTAPDSNMQLRHDLLDLAILSLRLNAQFSGPDIAPDARANAIQKLNEAEKLCGSNLVLELEKRDYLADSGTAANHPQLNSLHVANDAWEHDGIGRWLMHHEKLPEAEQQFATAIDIEPDDFWAHFQLMRCEYSLNEFDKAIMSATVCIALAPKRAECFYNRGLCYKALQQRTEAMADFNRALALDPKFSAAAEMNKQLRPAH